MLKVIDLPDDKQLALRSSAATTILYKEQFNHDFFADMITLSKVFDALGEGEDSFAKLSYEDLSHLDMTILYQVTWAFAKGADKSIGDLATWLDTFDEFPIMDIMSMVSEMLSTLFSATKKSTALTNRKKR